MTAAWGLFAGIVSLGLVWNQIVKSKSFFLLLLF